MTHNTDALALARHLASLGCSVIPIDHPDSTRQRDPKNVGKTPLLAWKEFQTAPPTDRHLIEWFGHGHPRNIGIVTGAGSNLVVVDCDSPEAVAWADAHLPATPWRVRTGKGEHRGYQHPGVVVGNQVRINTDDPAIKIDVRGDGGYVVGPGSLHASGVVYAWISGEPPSTDALPVFDPAWLKGEPTFADTRAETPIIPEGSRNDSLFREGCKLRRELEWGEERVAAVLKLLNRESCQPPLEEREVEAIAKSCMIAHDEDEICIEGGKLTEIIDKAEAALLKNCPIYQRGGVLTRAIKQDKAKGEATSVRREVGATVLSAVREPWLGEQMGKAIKWSRTSKKKKTSIDTPALYPRTLLGRGEWPFPVLRGIVTAPTLARDGRVIETPGFDRASGLLVDIPPGAFAKIPFAPTREDARQALAKLLDPMRGFPFVDEAAKAVAVSAMLTALVRVSLRTAPLHGFDAPTAGTGKSLLAEMAGLIATGFRPPAISQGKTAEEDEKRLATILFAGDRVIHIDNCERPISGDFLCSMLTQEVVQARVLGLNERRVLPSTALVLASGNNLSFAGDTSRRAVVCRLDAKVEQPDARTFDFDCHAEVLANRPELVVAGLTLLRAYVLAGRPETLTPMGSFDDWEWIRGALVWVDCADPADTRKEVLVNDLKKDELKGVMEVWEAATGSSPICVADIAAFAEHPANRDGLSKLYVKLVEVACRGGKWNAKSVGWWLRGNKERVIDGRRFQSEDTRYGQAWRLIVVDPAE